MKKSIYKIQNKINNKIYIGQSTNPHRRFREHKNMYHHEEINYPLYRAFRKYGVDNFSFEIIEEDIDNYNEREKYWIKYYDSYNCGYNQTEGGENPPHWYGENHPNAKLTQKDVDNIYNLLKTTKKSFIELGKMYNVHWDTISRINSGELWNDKKIIYPIRREVTIEYKQQLCENIINKLLNTTLTHKEIGEELNCAKSTVTMINIGKNHKNSNLIYPLRKNIKKNKEILGI